MSSAARGLGDWLRAAHPIARAAAAAAAGVAAFFAWIIAGFLTGVIAMCTTASEQWVSVWLLLLVSVPIWAAVTVWTLLAPDPDDSATTGRDRFARHLRRSPVRLLRLGSEPMDPADGE